LAVVLAHRADITKLSVPGVPKFNPMMLLHGEEKVENYSPIEVDTTVVITETIVDLQDKKKATVMVIESAIHDKETKELKAKIFTNLFIRGIGGFGHKGTYKNLIPAAPEGAPAHVSEETTTPNQAFIYRLCGDRNPLHVDP
jgi:peroxisomal enoyl-CoA hydratase 2